MFENNMQKICRICLKKTTSDRSSNIFIKFVTENPYLPSNEIIENDKLLICEILQSLTKLSITCGDGLPEQICANCEYRVIDSYLLCQLIEKSYEKLKQTKIEENKLIFVQNVKFVPALVDSEEHLEPNEEEIEIFHIGTEDPIKHEEEAIFIGSSAKDGPTEYDLNATDKMYSRIVNKLNCIIKKEDITDDDDNAVSFVLTDIIQNDYGGGGDGSQGTANSSDSLLILTETSKRAKKRSKIPHVCEICSKIFTDKSNLIVHLRWHANVRPFKCKYCDKSFVQNANYQQHLRIHTKEKPYACTYPQCTKSYSQSSTLRTHLRSHFQIKPYECSVCDKRFTCSSDLTKHRKRHFIALQTKCDECDQTFAQKGNYRKHKLKHHSNSNSGE